MQAASLRMMMTLLWESIQIEQCQLCFSLSVVLKTACLLWTTSSSVESHTPQCEHVRHLQQSASNAPVALPLRHWRAICPINCVAQNEDRLKVQAVALLRPVSLKRFNLQLKETKRFNLQLNCCLSASLQLNQATLKVFFDLRIHGPLHQLIYAHWRCHSPINELIN